MTNYASEAEFKSYTRIGDTLDDPEIVRILGATSRAIESHCSRKFWLDADGAPTVRTFVPCHWYLLDLERHEIGASDDLTITVDAGGDGTFELTLSASDFLLEPVNAPNEFPEAQPYTHIRRIGGTWPVPFTTWQSSRLDRVKVTARYGWPAVPDPVKEACLILGHALLENRKTPFGVAGFGDFGAIRVRENPKAVALLAPYRRAAVLAA